MVRRFIWKTSTELLGKSLAAASLIYLVPPLVARGLSFVVTPAYSHALDQEAFARIALVNTWIPVITLVLSMGVHLPLRWLYHEMDEHERETLRGSVLLLLTVIGVSLGLLLSGVLAYVDGPLLGLPRALQQPTLWAAFFGLFPNIPILIYSMREQPKYAAALILANGVTPVLFCGSSVLLFRAGAEGYAFAYLMANATLSVVALVATYKAGTRAPSARMARLALRRGLPLLPYLLGLWVLGLSDRLILEALVGATPLAAYAMSYSLASMLQMIVQSADRAFTPEIGRHLATQEGRGMHRKGRQTVGALATGAILVMAVAQEALQLVTPPEYHTAAYIPWICVGFYLQGVNSFVSQPALFSGRSHAIAVGTGLAAVANIGLNLTLIPLIGAKGAAVATAIAYALQTLFSYSASERVCPVAWPLRAWIGQTATVASSAAIFNLIPATSALTDVLTRWATVALGALIVFRLTKRGDTVPSPS